MRGAQIGLTLSIFVFGLAYGKVAQPPLPLEAAEEPAQPPMPMVYDEPQLDQPPPLTLDAPIEYHPQFKASNATVRYGVRDEDGNYRIDDMLLDEKTFKRNFGTDEERAELSRQAVPAGSERWPNGVMPYAFDSDVSYSLRQKVQQAIGAYNAIFGGCINIRPRQASDQHYVIVTARAQGDCFAEAGLKHKGPQRCQLQPGTYCEYDYTIQHEFTHALGVWHIQNRPDRDQYVTINWSNIPQSSYINFKLLPELETYGIPYNGRSVMHYYWNSHALNRNVPTINSKMADTPNNVLGTNKKMAETDIALVKKMYCGGETGGSCTLQNKNNNCDNWASQGLCSGQYATWLAANCAKSCTKNIQSDANCKQWAGQGLCKQGNYVAWLKTNCAKACAGC